ncbi:MAG: hypothetical protein RIR00_1307 [Pseudomonadota bacterium]|jgi:uncharacterized protein (TIGR02449 family)
MDMELNTLEARIDQAVNLIAALRAENSALRAQLAAGESESRELRQKINVARERLEGLLERLPEDQA